MILLKSIQTNKQMSTVYVTGYVTQHHNSLSKRHLCCSGELLLLCKNLKLTNLDKSSIIPNAEAYVPVCTEQNLILQSDGVTVQLFLALCFLKIQETMPKISTKDTFPSNIPELCLQLRQEADPSRFQQASIQDSVCHFSLNFPVVCNKVSGFVVNIVNTAWQLSVKIITHSFLKHKLIQLRNTSVLYIFCTVKYSQDQVFTQYKQNLGGEFCFTSRQKVSILGTLEKSLGTIRFSIAFAWNSIFPFGRGSIWKCCSFQTIS